MIVLGIDTSGVAGGLALVTEDKVISECVLDVRRTYSERLMVALDFMMSGSGLSVSEINGVAVSRGPGSYTGLRIGVTIAKTLCYCLGIPLTGVSTLRAIAQSVAGLGVTAIPLIDARQDRVYASAYVFEFGDTRGTEAIPESLTTIDRVIEQVADLPGDLCFVGSGAVRHQEELRSRTNARLVSTDPTLSLCRPSSVATLGLDALRDGTSEDIMDFAPEYLRPSAAEVRWMEKHEGHPDSNSEAGKP